MTDPQVGDELTNRFGERCIIKAIHPDYLEIAVHREPETAYWDLECWRQELLRATTTQSGK